MKYLTGGYDIFTSGPCCLAIKRMTAVIFMSRKRISSGYLFDFFLSFHSGSIHAWKVSIIFFLLVSREVVFIFIFFVPIVWSLTESIKRQ